MIAPKGDWTRFSDEKECFRYLKRIGLIPRTQNYIQQFSYSGLYTKSERYCQIVGYVDDITTVIDIDGSLHCINPSYLSDMQTGKFRTPVEYVVLDIETTGLSPRKDKMIEFAAVRFFNFEEQESFVSLINPECPLSPHAIAVNGITEEMIDGAPCIRDVLPKIIDFIGSNPIVGHNVGFDVGFLLPAFEKINYKMKNKLIDTLKLSKNAFPGLPSYSLESLRHQLNIVTDSAHRALPDVYATAQLFKICIDNYKAPTLSRIDSNADFSVSGDQLNDFDNIAVVI